MGRTALSAALNRARERSALLLEDADQLSGWLMTADRGEVAVYWRGHLSRDRYGPPYSLIPGFMRRVLNRLAVAAMAAHMAGHARLYQRRHGPDDYSYIIVRK
jgi:hypothetical protein